MTFQLAGLAMLAAFYALFFVVGVYASRRLERQGDSEQWLLARRNLPLWLGAATMTATWVGGGYINGTAEYVADSARGLVYAQAPWGYALSLIVGGLVFARPMRRHRFVTLMDLFERRYGKRIAAVLYVPALLGEIFWSGAILAALGTTVAVVLDLGDQVRAAILISAAIAITYTVLGGLLSVAYTDALQLFCIFAGLLVAAGFALNDTGGWAATWSSYQAKFGEGASFLPPRAAFDGTTERWGYSGWSWTDASLLLIFGGIPWQVYFQRVLASKNDRTAVRLSVLAGFGCLLLAMPPIVIGMIGATVDWSATAAGGPPPSYQFTVPYVLRYLTPPVVGAVGLGAVAAAVMSSVDSSFLSASSMSACNIYRPLLRPSARDREMRLVLQAGVILVGLAAALLALTVGSVYVLWYLCSDLVYVILFPQLLTALFFRPANKPGAMAGMAVGFVLRAGGGEVSLGIPALIPYPMFNTATQATDFPFKTLAMLASLATIVVVSLATKRWSPPRPLEP